MFRICFKRYSLLNEAPIDYTYIQYSQFTGTKRGSPNSPVDEVVALVNFPD